MTSLLVAWIAFPLLLSALSLGCGLLVERASGFRLPGTLILPVGFALLAVGAQLATARAATASARGSACLCPRGGRLRAVLSVAWPPTRLLGARGGFRRLRRVCGTRRRVGPGHVGRVHQAGRQLDAAGARRPGHAATAPRSPASPLRPIGASSTACSSTAIRSLPSCRSGSVTRCLVRTPPGCTSRVWRSWLRCSRSRSTS